jgi:O-antigen ligase
MGSRDVEAPARHRLIATVFLVIAIILGGGGSANPFMEVLVQLACVLAVLAWLWVPGSNRAVPVPASRLFWLVCALILALPAIQLVPVPRGVWSMFDVQGNRAAALELVGREHSWQPLAQYPARTLASLLSLIPPLFAFFAATSLGPRGRFWLVGVITVMALATTLLGALQLSLGADGPYLYGLSAVGSVAGFQANRNATADLLLMGIVASAAFLAPSIAPRDLREGFAPGLALPADRRAAGVALTGILVLLFFAAVMTRSRTGIALVPLALLAVGLIVRPALADLGRLRYLPAAAAGAAILAVAYFATLGGNTVLGTVASRFAVKDDARIELWRDAWFAVGNAWPFGVGVGGAEPALIAAERLEVLDPLVPNRVHNDYLELALEGGLPAVLSFAAIVLILATLAWWTWRDRPRERLFTALGVAILGIAAAHSFVDYPLRSMALACLVGTGAGLLVASPRRPPVVPAPGNGSRVGIGDLS